MPSPQASSKPVPACLPPPPVPFSSHVDLLSNATVIICSREDLCHLLTTSPSSQPGLTWHPTPTVSKTAFSSPSVPEALKSSKYPLAVSAPQSSQTPVILCSRDDIFHLLTAPPPPQSGPAHFPTSTVARDVTPAPKAPEPPSMINENDDNDSFDTASQSSQPSLKSVSSQIPKPEGEPGRPGRGGYNLEAQLAWNSTTFLKLKKFVHRSIKKHLDTTKCKSRQSNEAVRLVIQEALKAFPDLEDYSACWPVRDLIQMRLKYTSRRARLLQCMGT